MGSCLRISPPLFWVPSRPLEGRLKGHRPAKGRYPTNPYSSKRPAVGRLFCNTTNPYSFWRFGVLGWWGGLKPQTARLEWLTTEADWTVRTRDGLRGRMRTGWYYPRGGLIVRYRLLCTIHTVLIFVMTIDIIRWRKNHITSKARPAVCYAHWFINYLLSRPWSTN